MFTSYRTSHFYFKNIVPRNLCMMLHNNALTFQELFGETGVLMVVQYLNGYVNAKSGPMNNQKLVLSATDCIW